MAEAEGFEDITPTAVEAGDTDAYALVYAEQHPRLVAYARSLTRNAWQAEDLVAEAHFRVWRRLSGGHSIENVPAYLATVIRNLAATVGAAASREVPQDPGTGFGIGRQPTAADEHAGDPAQRVAYVDLLGDVLKQLPERWVRALWLAEAEDQPLEAVGRQLGTNPNATAVLLSRAREGLRQAFLRAQPGEPADSACAGFWERMPAHVRDVDSPRHAAALRAHTETCEDCRARMLLLMQANNRLPALVGPAMLVLVGGGALRFLAVAGAGAGAAAGAGASAVAGAGQAGGVGGGLGGVGSGVAGFAGGSLSGSAVAAGVAGIAVVAAAIAVAAAMASGGSSKPTLVERAADDRPSVTAAQQPAPSAAPATSASATADPTASATTAAGAAPVALTATSVPPLATLTPTASADEPPSATPSATATSPEPVVTPTVTASATATPTVTATPSATPTVTPTTEPSETAEPSPSPTVTATPTAEPEPSPSESYPGCGHHHGPGSVADHCERPPHDHG